MQQQDQSAAIEKGEEQAEAVGTEEQAEANATDATTSTQPVTTSEENDAAELDADENAQRRIGFDWLALGVVLLIAAIFALTARLNTPPAPSFIPSTIFSATGCGLLITALRKIRNIRGLGLIEAALGGFSMALFQLAVAFTYPEIFTTITTVPQVGHLFLLTWGLVGLTAIVLSLAGATLGHLAFAPLRPAPVKAAKQVSDGEYDEDEEVEEEDLDELEESEQSEQILVVETDEGVLETLAEVNEDESEDAEETEELSQAAAVIAQPQRSLLNYAITVLLLGILPIMVGYVFAAIYDYTMASLNVQLISPAFYPTLSLLSGLLPWRLAVPIDLTGANGSFILFTLLWRIPDNIFANPNLFDVQTLEAFVFNATALALLLIATYGRESSEHKKLPVPVRVFLALELLLGFILVLPSDLWIFRGLEGVVQITQQSQTIIAEKIQTIFLLNPLLFILNLVTGPLVCLLIGLIVRRQYQLWTTPRENGQELFVEHEQEGY